MLYKISSESETVNIYENYTQNFTLNNLTIPLARKLAVAVFIDSRPGMERVGFETDDAICNSGNIIIENYMQFSVISRSLTDMQKSSIDSHTNCKVPVPGMSKPVESHDCMLGLRIWRRFASIFLLIWKNFMIMYKILEGITGHKPVGTRQKQNNAKLCGLYEN